MKLAAKLILIFLLGVLGIVGITAWQSYRREQAWEQQRRDTQAAQLVDAISPAIAKAYDEGGTITLEQAVEVSSQTAGTEMRWVNGSEVPVPSTKTTTRKLSSLSVTNANGTRTAYSYVPLTMDGENAGTVEVAHPLEEHDAFVRRSIVTSVSSLAGVALLSAVVIYFGGIRLVGRPLDKLITQVNAIGDGNLDQPPVLSGNDELGRLATAISNMSHRLKEQRDTIRHTDRLGTVGTLAAGVAHELGTPLNVVSGRAGLIAGGKLSSEEVTASANTIKDESDRMTKIIRQLLDFARQTPSPHETIDLQDTVTRTCDLMRPLAKKGHVAIEVTRANSPVHIQGDKGQIQQVLTNLISNAIAAMPDGGTATVTVRQPNEAGFAAIQVKDTGVGIESEDIGRIFEPFYTTKDVGQGTGLGLSIAYGIVTEHGGEINVSSERGEHTTFSVLRPANSTAQGKEARQ